MNRYLRGGRLIGGAAGGGPRGFTGGLGPLLISLDQFMGSFTFYISSSKHIRVSMHRYTEIFAVNMALGTVRSFYYVGRND